MNKFSESEQELISGMTNHRLYMYRNMNETTVCWKIFAVPPKGTCKLLFAHFSWM